MSLPGTKRTKRPNLTKSDIQGGQEIAERAQTGEFWPKQT